VGFDVGESKDFAKEARMTVRNKKLMRLLVERRRHGKRISLKEVRKLLVH
jgi:hypothetical protein